MASDRIDPSNQFPEADLLEQRSPLDPPLTDAEHMPIAPEAPTEPVDDVDRWEQQAPVPAAEDDYPHRSVRSRRVVMADPLMEVAVRLYADFADRITLAEVRAVVARCRNDLDVPGAAALPELVERLARQRLTDHAAPAGTDRASANAEH